MKRNFYTWTVFFLSLIVVLGLLAVCGARDFPDLPGWEWFYTPDDWPPLSDPDPWGGFDWGQYFKHGDPAPRHDRRPKREEKEEVAIVPSKKYPTIQSAIDTDDNDVWLIQVQPGVYFEDIDFRGKEVTVYSSNGPRGSVIYGRVKFTHNETEYSILDGFTIQGHRLNNYNRGGCIYIEDSEPTITDCVITGGYARQGGGICCISGSPNISRCIITGNLAELGGGLYLSAFGGYINSCFILSNFAIKPTENDSMGGGIYLINSSSCDVIGTCFYGNLSHRGGGMYVDVISNPALDQSWFVSNEALGVGGGLYHMDDTNMCPNVFGFGNVPDLCWEEPDF